MFKIKSIATTPMSTRKIAEIKHRHHGSTTNLNYQHIMNHTRYSRKRGQSLVQKNTGKSLKRAINDAKLFIKKYIQLLCEVFPELLLMRSYKYVAQSVFHQKLFDLLKPTLFDLYQVSHKSQVPQLP